MYQTITKDVQKGFLLKYLRRLDSRDYVDLLEKKSSNLYKNIGKTQIVKGILYMGVSLLNSLTHFRQTWCLVG